MNRKRVLIITYYFPPRPGVASLRLRGLAKYLPEFDWEPVILTASLPGQPDPMYRVIQTPYPGDVLYRIKRKLHLQGNKGFMEQIGIPLQIREGRKSVTSSMIRLTKGIVAYPDDQKDWLPFAVKTANELLKKEKYDALLSSSCPVTAHLIAKELKVRHHIPWIADLRDLWTQNYYYEYGVLRKCIERRLEVKTLALADALVTVSEPLRDKLRALHRRKPVSVSAILNGFDPDDVGCAPLTKEFTITYTGHIYAKKRNPEILLEALNQLILEGVIDQRKVKLRFFGPTQYWFEREIKRHHLEGVAKQYGIVPRDVALTKQRESQVLLQLTWNDPREQGVYTGKIFEYLASGRPILSIGWQKGVVSELLQETGTGIHVSNLTTLKKVVSSWYDEYNKTGSVSYHGKADEVGKYSHREMARKFSKLLNEVSGW